MCQIRQYWKVPKYEIGDDASLIVTKEAAIQMREESQKAYENLLRILGDDSKKIFYGAGIKEHKMIEQYKNNMRNIIGVAVTRKPDDFLGEFPIKNIEDYLLYREDALNYNCYNSPIL